MLKIILKDCVVEKVMKTHELEEIGRVLMVMMDKIMTNYAKTMKQFRIEIKDKKAKLAKAENPAEIATRNEKVLFDGIKFLNFVYNPLLKTD